MHVVKPLQLGILHRSYGYHGRSLFAVSALMGFHLRTGEFLLEQALWQAIGKSFGKGAAVFDSAMPKDRPEVLVQGAFHAPGGQPVEAGKVAVQLGGWRKELAVFGDRHWRPGLGPSRPEPMTRMPVAYSHAFGGPEDLFNPAGKGQVEDPDSGRRPLPNVENPRSLIGSPSDRPRPAGFAPLDQTWEPRASKRGTYDERWLKERAPGLADDIDWSFFNDAPADQWLDAPPRGGEPFLIEHMHPQWPRLQGSLPTAYGRAFAEICREQGPSFEEIPLRPDTVWFFPEDELGVVIWRGSTLVASEDPAEVGKLLLAFEDGNDAARPLEHYREELRKRTDPAQAFRYLLNTSALIPLGARCGFQQMQDDNDFPALDLHAMKNADAKVQAQRQQLDEMLAGQRADLQARLQAAGVDPAPYLAAFDQRATGDAQSEALLEQIRQLIPTDEHGRLDLTRLDFDKIDAFKAQADALGAVKKEEVRQLLEANLHELAQQLNADGQPLMSAERIAEVMARVDAKPPLPRGVDPAQIEQIRQQIRQAEEEFARLRASGDPHASLADVNLDIGDIEAVVADANARILEAYRSGAHLMAEGAPPHQGREAEVAAQLLRRFGNGESLRGGDFAAVNLAGARLAGIDLSQALLEDVDLSGADLSGADLSGAVMVRAKLAGVRLDGARLIGANLGGSDLSDASLDGADLEGAVLSGCRLERTRLCRARLLDVQLLETRFAETDFSDAELGALNFIEADLRGARFLRARLPKAVFIKCRLQGADFSEAEAAEATFVEPQAAEVCFRQARLANARFVGGAELQGADFSGAELERANLAATQLQGADFSDARLDMAYFGEANLARARLQRVNAPRAVFNKADLEGADLSRANLMEASFHQARLVAARYRGANLYAADFQGCVLGETDFGGANLDRSLLQDWRPA